MSRDCWTTAEYHALAKARRPRGRPRHELGCAWSCGGVFRCDDCRALVGWCKGGDFPGAQGCCARCACRREARQNRRRKQVRK